MMKAILFFLSIVFHLVFVQWLIHVRMPLRITHTETVIEVRLVKKTPLTVPEEWFGHKPKKIDSKKILTPGKNEWLNKENGALPSTQTPAPLLSIEDNQPAETLPVPAPNTKLPTDFQLPKRPNFSVYSQDYKNMMNEFNRSFYKMKNDILSAETDPGFQRERLNIALWSKNVLPVIQKNWNIPIFTASSPSSFALITVIIEKDGTVSSRKIKKSSGVTVLDQAAIRAITLSSPLASLPGDFPARGIELTFRFDYEWK